MANIAVSWTREERNAARVARIRKTGSRSLYGPLFDEFQAAVIRAEVATELGFEPDPDTSIPDMTPEIVAASEDSSPQSEYASSLEEIATELGVSRARVQQIIMRALRKLRKKQLRELL